MPSVRLRETRRSCCGAFLGIVSPNRVWHILDVLLLSRGAAEWEQEAQKARGRAHVLVLEGSSCTWGSVFSKKRRGGEGFLF